MEFVVELEMGAFYAKRLKQMLKKQPPPLIYFLGDLENERRHIAKLRERDEAFRALLIEKRGEVKELMMELLDFQEWT